MERTVTGKERERERERVFSPVGKVFGKDGSLIEISKN